MLKSDAEGMVGRLHNPPGNTGERFGKLFRCYYSSSDTANTTFDSSVVGRWALKVLKVKYYACI